LSTFVVSARKYRPVRFDEVVGQEHVTQTLKNALRQGKLAHAFLFCGPRGVGKTTCARILAKALNCQNASEDFEPCNACEACEAFQRNASFNITELDAASNNSVEHIRALIEQVRFQPQQGKYKIFIIDEVHMLSQQAFNAFLKTLEEPPPYAVFILATTEKHKIIPTILSRCQIYDFRRIQPGDMAAHLRDICRAEGLEAEDDALHVIAQKADGALRDALSIFDRIASFSGPVIRYEEVIENLNVLDYDYYFRAADALLGEDASGILLLFDEVTRKGFDGDIFLNGLAEHLRNLLVCKDEATLPLLEGSEALRRRYHEQATLTPATLILTALNIANDCDVEYKMARNKRLHVEMALLKMTYILRAAAIPAAAGMAAGAGLVEKKNPPESEREVVETRNFSSLQSSTPISAPQPPPATAPQPSPQPPPAAESAARAAARRATPAVMSPEALAARLRAESPVVAVVETEYNLSLLREYWREYAEKHCAQETVRAALKQTELGLEGRAVVAVVASTLAENTLRQESDLMDFLRECLGVNDLALIIRVDREKAPKAPPRAKPLSDKEKFLKMAEANPLVRTLRERFDLRPEEP
jgi:DNA polymerase-3 subunit gamma/tau